MTNTLYYGDNLKILKDHIPDESIDLIYLDPPFNSNRTYNVLFRERSGEASPAQIEAFTDTWTWDRSAEKTYDELVIDGPASVSQMIGAMRQFIGSNDMMAYLVMMAARLVELHRVLKPTGSLYLHCDPTASHYLKIVLDSIFGFENFKNEIVWKRADAHNDARHQFPVLGDRLLLYGRSRSAVFHPQHGGYQERTLRDWYQYLEFPDGNVRKMTKQERESQEIPEDARRFNSGDLRSPNPRPNLTYSYKGYNPHRNGWAVSLERMKELDRQGRLLFPSSPDGRIMYKRYLDEQPGAVIGDVWTDVSQLRGADRERLGYPTQKPLTLLERIINASSNPGDVVLDPFCGCGTAVAAAQKLGRQWIGIDVTHLAITLIKNRLTDSFPGIEFDVRGEPADEGAARMLAEADRYQFQWWALSLVHAKPGEGKEKKGADRGIDGVIVFIDDASHKPKRCLVQVKSGGVKSGDVRDLVGTLQRESAALGLFVTLDAPSRAMTKEAVEAGFYDSPGWGRQFPKVQIITIDELLNGKKPDLPPARQPFQQAPVIGEIVQQTVLGLVD